MKKKTKRLVKKKNKLERKVRRLEKSVKKNLKKAGVGVAAKKSDAADDKKSGRIELDKRGRVEVNKGGGNLSKTEIKNNESATSGTVLNNLKAKFDEKSYVKDKTDMHGGRVISVKSAVRETKKDSGKKEDENKAGNIKANSGFEKDDSKKGILDKYDIEVDGAKVNIEIIRGDKGITYNLYIPEINPATSTLLSDIRNELVSITTVSMKELVDPAAFFSIKKRFMDDARKLLRLKLPKLDESVEKFLSGMLMQEMLGLGKLEFMVADSNLEEIVLPSAKEPIRVFSKKYGWLLTNIIIEREEEIVNYANIIARRVGKQITVLSPLLDAHLITGDRINAVLYPVNTKGN